MAAPQAGSPMPPLPTGGMPQMAPGGLPQMPMNPMNPMMPQAPMQMHPSPMNHPNAAPARTSQTTDLDLLKKLFQEIIKLLKET